MSDTDEILVSNLKLLMKSMGFDKYRQFAEYLGVPDRTLNSIMNGDRGATVQYLHRICELTDYEPWQMVSPFFATDMNTGDLAEIIVGYMKANRANRQQMCEAISETAHDGA